MGGVRPGAEWAESGRGSRQEGAETHRSGPPGWNGPDRGAPVPTFLLGEGVSLVHLRKTGGHWL